MATIRLIPSTYYLSSTSYLSVANEDRMYNNTDNSTYATVTNSRTQTTSYYIYLRGFNFSDVPSSAIVNSFTIKLKAYESGVSTSTNYRPYLCDGTTALSGYSNVLSSSVQTLTFTGITEEWDEIVNYGADFGIRINCRRSSKNTTSYVYIYGAEIEVDYTLPISRTVTSSLVGNGTINPSGATSTYDGATYTLTITPTNVDDEVTIKKNNIDVTGQLVAHYPETSANTVLGDYTLISGGFNGSGESYFSGIVGHGVNASQTTSNYYSSSSSTEAVFTYDLSVTVPSNAIITRVYCEVNGHAESSSNSSEYMCVQLKSGSVELSEQINYREVSTSNTTITLEANTLPSVSQLSNMVLECTLGYYGGAINGATCYVEYSLPNSTLEYYTYSYTVDEDATIIVTIKAVSSYTWYQKVNSSWSVITCSKIYKKINGTWVEQSDMASVFDISANYVNGNT